jgi:hypothetical protein
MKESELAQATTEKSELAHPASEYSFSFDGLATMHDSSFMNDHAFQTAYHWTRDVIGKDYQWYWRNYLGIRLAEYAINISSNFVECGVGECWMTLSLLKYFEVKGIKMPYLTLFDTFSGIASDIVDPQEEEYWGMSAEQKKALYEYNPGLDIILKRLSKTTCPADHIKVIEGTIPRTLSSDVITEIKHKGDISYLHIDMNNSVPEVAALDQFYPCVATGGIILLDDYAYSGYFYQKQAIDKWCIENKIAIPLPLPTGQGLLIKSLQDKH